MRLYGDELINRFREATDPVGKDLDEKEIIAFINLAQDKVAQRVGYNIEKKRTMAAVANQELYDLPNKCRKIITVRYNGDVVYGTSMSEIERLSEGSRYTTGEIDYVYIRGKQLGFYYCPDEDAEVAYLSASMSATATSFSARTTLTGADEVEDFTTRGTVKIGDEKIDYINITGNTTYSTFTVPSGGRGVEGTIATTHSSDDLVTLQNIEIVGLFDPSNFINKPWGGVMTAAAGGSVDVGTHYYYITFYSSSLDMESLPYPLGSITISGTNKTVSITGVSVSRDPDVDYWRLYRTKAGAEVYHYVNQIANGTTTTTDTVADSTLSTRHVYPYSELMDEYHELIVDMALLEFFRRHGVAERISFFYGEVERMIQEAMLREVQKRNIRYRRLPYPS